MAMAAIVLCLLAVAQSAHAVELTVSRAALERTLVQQLFSGPDGHYYLKGNAHSACSVYAENPEVSFAADRVQVKVKIHARLGTSVTGHCVGLTLAPSVEVSMVPEAEGESIGFRDARVEHVSESRELNFLLMPFLSHQIPSSMKVNAADLLRRALASSTANSGYQVTLDRLKIHSMLIQGDAIVLDADGDLSVH
ncbi:MAG TPA: hypothetical protein VIY53_06955 [Acidobacteriaceae bacterium]